jgi:ABC-type lipoprotein export system ATPase subunit
MNSVLLELKDVNFYNDDYQVLKNINLKININENTAIIGKSGSGKSTLLKLISGIISPTNGSIIVNQFTTDNDLDSVIFRKNIGFVFQDGALISNLNIKENLELPLKFKFPYISKNEMENKIIYLLERINLKEALYERPAHLSHGEIKLISIARSIITKPNILFMDEPLTFLDASNSKLVIEILKEYIQNNNATLIFVTNLKSIIQNIAERIILIEDKTINFDNYMNNIKNFDRNKLPKLLDDIING